MAMNPADKYNLKQTNMVSYIYGGKQAKGIWEQDPEAHIWAWKQCNMVYYIYGGKLAKDIWETDPEAHIWAQNQSNIISNV